MSFDWGTKAINIQSYYWKVNNISCHFIDFVVFDIFLILVDLPIDLALLFSRSLFNTSIILFGPTNSFQYLL